MIDVREMVELENHQFIIQNVIIESSKIMEC